MHYTKLNMKDYDYTKILDYDYEYACLHVYNFMVLDVRIV